MKSDYLYHYTSIEALAMILSTKSIKFNSLNHVDDVIEGKSKDYKNIGDYFFISSWTDIEEENLPFWNMYTPNMEGVRIKMPSDLFNTFIITTDDRHGLSRGLYFSIVPEDETFAENYWVIPTHNTYLSKIEYTDDLDKLFPLVKSTLGNDFTLELNKIGKYKSSHWKFQSEWRFVLKILPTTSKNPLLSSQESSIISDALFSMENGDKLPFSNFFVNINNDKFKEMEILLGPKHNIANQIIVESLINTYNPQAKLTISSLHNKIK